MKTLLNYPARTLMTLFVLFTLLNFSGCSEDDEDKNTPNDNPQNTNEVLIQGTAYSPSEITVTAGTRVTWRNRDGMTHTVTSDAGLFDSGDILNNGSYSFTFSTPGNYPYFCKLHTGMRGVVIVN